MVGFATPTIGCLQAKYQQNQLEFMKMWTLALQTMHYHRQEIKVQAKVPEISKISEKSNLIFMSLWGHHAISSLQEKIGKIKPRMFV